MRYAYDHTIVYNTKEQKGHFYVIIHDNKEFNHLSAVSLTQQGCKMHQTLRYKNMEIWASYFIAHEGKYLMFNISFGEPRQIGYVVSTYLYHWFYPI